MGSYDLVDMGGHMSFGTSSRFAVWRMVREEHLQSIQAVRLQARPSRIP